MITTYYVENPDPGLRQARKCGGINFCHYILCVILKKLSSYLRGGSSFKNKSCLLSGCHKCFMLQFNLFHLYSLSKFVSTQPSNQETIENRQSRVTDNFGQKTQNEDKQKITQLSKLKDVSNTDDHPPPKIAKGDESWWLRRVR